MKVETMKSTVTEILKSIRDDPDNIDILNNELRIRIYSQASETEGALDDNRILNIVSDMEDIIYWITNIMNPDDDVDPDVYNVMIDDLEAIPEMEEDEYNEFNTAFKLLLGFDIVTFLSRVKLKISNKHEYSDIKNIVFANGWVINFTEYVCHKLSSDVYDIVYTSKYVNIETVPDHIYHYYLKKMKYGEYMVIGADKDNLDKYEEDYVNAVVMDQVITICSRRRIPKNLIVYLVPPSDRTKSKYNPSTGKFEDIPEKTES